MPCRCSVCVCVVLIISMLAVLDPVLDAAGGLLGSKLVLSIWATVCWLR